MPELIVVGRSHRDKAAVLCDHVNGTPTSIISCGVGPWDEGEVLLERWPDANYVGFEPLNHFIVKAERRGYPGPIDNCALWNEIAPVTLHLKGQRTSAFPEVAKEYGDRLAANSQQKTVQGYPLDHLMPSYDRILEAGNFLLWMDAEGSELAILRGATEALLKTNWIVIELVTMSGRVGWPHADDVIQFLNASGFEMTCRVGKRKRCSGYDALFTRIAT